MPGIAGCLTNSGSKEELAKAIERLTYAGSYKVDRLYTGHHFRCRRVHQNIIGEKDSPVSSSSNFIWLEGEFYNAREIAAQFELKEAGPARLLLEAYRQEKLLRVLNKVDGYFCAVLYDRQKEELLFISDRHGLKPLYIWGDGQDLIWCSELKGLCAFDRFPREVDKKSIATYLEVGHLIGAMTWFKNSIQLGASKVLTYSLQQKKIIGQHRYWSWNEVSFCPFDYPKACDQLIDLIKKAVARRYTEEVDSAISLSGGLDSRTILAGLQDKNPLQTYTFGQKHSLDVRLAKRFTKAVSASHRHFEINERNWLHGRLDSIWKSEGQFSFIHSHAGQFHKDIARFCRISYNGLGGHDILGGGYLTEDREGITASSLEKKGFKSHLLDEEHLDFCHLDRLESFLISNRIRRFTANGMNEIKDFENRLPLIDNQLFEFVFSLPEHFRHGGRIYLDALQKAFPRLFKNTVTNDLYNHNKSTLGKLAYRIRNAFLSRLGRSPYINYADYKRWGPDQKDLMNSVINSKNAIIFDLMSERPIYFSDLKNDNSFAENHIELSRLFTLEVWFQQIFQSRFLTAEDLF